ncbi:MAG: hypothetical protein MRECE_18c005 [Mycoplasmataceae bacterium CE_OT135]|nr:MAG: hypothetical protein MRECE_29c005 [Mycoplasmataceae bacterium CE_OT135]KLL03360.1 MAG: hypothetical protein MRECE_18c005 [Mycoplasmataceae bacterium CE_OT135]
MNINSQKLTNEQLKKEFNNCCGKGRNLVEIHQEEDNRTCYKYVCFRCKSDVFKHGEKPSKSIILTTKQYENLLGEMEEMSKRQKDICQLLRQAGAD